MYGCYVEAQYGFVLKLHVVKLYVVALSFLYVQFGLVFAQAVGLPSVYDCVAVHNHPETVVIAARDVERLVFFGGERAVHAECEVAQVDARSECRVAAIVKVYWRGVCRFINRFALHLGVVPEACAYAGLAAGGFQS